ncbi:MAG TPA: type I DNA topoisomerase [Clostridiales bacterium]|nr:type I DNA topoisomerase [Clostridiales bacterium]
MAQKLVIVESPTKANTIKKFLGKGYKVEATMGHVRDLPKSQFGIDIENNFTPKYITIRGKGKTLNKLKKEAKSADIVYLATDPDREGEAISWHLAHVLNIDEDAQCRIEFNEITKDAVRNAIKKPRTIDMNLVNAQQARRILDRIVGYNISPLLWRKVKKGLSAGRVQSVATRIVCEREREIEDFKPEEYWSLKGIFEDEDSSSSLEASFYGKPEEKIELKTEEQVNKIIEELDGVQYRVDSVKKGSRRRNPSPPFITSSLQQEASRKLGFSTKKTMVLAQQLYEGIEIEGEGAVGLITYMRTDSTRISKEAQNQARKYIEEKYGKEYVPKVAKQYKTKKNAQDAHEAIRPTSVMREPDKIKASLNREQYRLYKLIYDRFIASQMTAAVYETMSVHILGGKYLFKANGSRMVFPGFTIVYQEGSDDEKEEEDIMLPMLKEGQTLQLKEFVPEQHFTKPPPRYTEASLVRALEEMGIGRPSTYAPTISTIITRGYIEREGRQLVPTELGFIVNDLMMEHFPDIVDYQFTADMEAQLDQVEEGKKEWRDILKEFYPSFKEDLEKADKRIEKIEIQDEETDVVCEKCGANMVIKNGRYGKFLACPNFPKCRNTKPIIETIDVDCPKCGASVVVRKSKKGRKFYGCEQYPNCDFISWDMPSNEKCPQCGEFMVVKNNRKKDEKILKCSNKNCKYEKVVEKS